ncbi:flavin reductase family protein [Jatrophihabitans fulvus]
MTTEAADGGDAGLTPARFAPEVLRSAYASFPTGVTVIAAEFADGPVGMAASSFTSVSLDPPLVSVNIARTSGTWATLRDGMRQGGRLGVSVLADDQPALARQFAARGIDRFAGVRTTTADGGAVLVDHACLWLECTVFAEFAAGDHVITVLEVHELEAFPDRPPLVFHSSEFRQLDFPTR